jgi:hypothetical protein
MSADVLRRMEHKTKSLHSALDVVHKRDHIVVFHRVHGEIAELYPEDYLHFLEIVREALTSLEGN